MAEMRRMNIRVDDVLYNYFRTRSEETGVSMSSLIFLALEQYIEQKEAMKQLPAMVNKINDMEQQMRQTKVV